jgi:hypothetical protein
LPLKGVSHLIRGHEAGCIECRAVVVAPEHVPHEGSGETIEDKVRIGHPERGEETDTQIPLNAAIY